MDAEINNNNNNFQAANNTITEEVYKDSVPNVLNIPAITTICNSNLVAEKTANPVELQEEQPEPVQQEENSKMNLSETQDYFTFITDHSDFDIILTPTKKHTIIQVKYKGRINGTNIKAKTLSELMDISKNYDTKIIRMIMQVTGIERKEAKKIANEFMTEIGKMDFKTFEQVIEQTNMFEIDLTQFCDETIKLEMVEKAVELTKDGNTKKYVADRLQQEFNLDKKDSTYVADIADDIQEAQIRAINPLDFFLDENQKQLNALRLTNEIMKYNNFITLGYDGKKDIYVYQNGIYVNKGKLVIKKYVNAFLSMFVKEEFRNEVIRYIEIETYTEREKLNNNTMLINLKNGMYNLETNELIDHDPKHLSTMRIPVKYDPNAICPNIDKFLSEVVSEEDVVTLTEYLGYCLIPDVRMQRALMVFGHAGNGKSVFLNLARRILGKPNTSAIALQKLAHDKFAVAGLFGMLANICPDIPAFKLKTDEVFKMIVGADEELNAEKKFMDQFEFKNYARLMFSANVLPEPANDPDDNEAYYRRWLLVPFPHTFKGKSNNKKLINELTTDEEKSGYLNKLLQALQTILKNGNFTYEKSAEEVEAMYKVNMASIDKFFEDKVEIVEIKGRYTISKEDMYDRYCKWCEENGAIPKPNNTFGNILLNDHNLKYKRIGKRKISHWLDVKWKVSFDLDSEYPDPDEENQNTENNDIIGDFCKSRVTIGGIIEPVSLIDLYQLYTEYCKESSTSPMNLSQFFTAFISKNNNVAYDQTDANDMNSIIFQCVGVRDLNYSIPKKIHLSLTDDDDTSVPA